MHISPTDSTDTLQLTDSESRSISTASKIDFENLYIEENCKMQLMKSNFDYVLIRQSDPEVFRLCILTYFIEIMALIFAIYVADRDAKHKDYRISAVYIGGFLSSIFVCSIAYHIMVRLTIVILSRTRSSFMGDLLDLVNFQRSIIIVLEVIVFVLVSIATFLLVPQQDDIIQMMLNCTGIISVAQIDECLYHVFKVERSFVDENLFALKLEKKFLHHQKNIRIGFVVIIFLNTAIFVNVARIYNYAT